MLCPSCGLNNDPASLYCARCNAGLAGYVAQQQYGYQPQIVSSRSGSPVGSRSAAWPLAALGIAVIVGVVFLFGLKLVNRHSPTNGTPVANNGPASVASVQPTGDGPADGRARQQATAIDGILDASSASRRKLNNAIDHVGRCSGVGAALSDLRAVGDERRAQIADLDQQDLSALASADQIRSTLRSALQSSLSADEKFVEWAEVVASYGCGSKSASYDDARSYSDQAGTYKQQFIGVWNGVASQFGLPTRSRENI
jgi:hypothetical protein